MNLNLTDEQKALLRYDAQTECGRVKMGESKEIDKRYPYRVFNFRGVFFAGYFYDEKGDNPPPLFDFIKEVELAVINNHSKTIIAKLQPLP